jgi:hypothetical protein
LPEIEAILVLLAVVAALATLADRIRVPYPILLVLGGLVLGFVPGLPKIELEPELVFFILFHEVLAHPASDGLARLSRLVAEERLRPHVSVEASWEEIGEVAQRLLDRGYTGKAVLNVGG